MESNLNKVAKEALSKVSGYAVVDSQGLVLSAEGVAKDANAALISTIAQLASKLEPGSSKPPVENLDTIQGINNYRFVPKMKKYSCPDVEVKNRIKQ